MAYTSLKIAGRYIFAKKSHSAVNLISIVAVCGIVISTTAIVCVLSVFNGFSDLIQSKLASLDPDIKITAAKGKTISNADSILDIVSCTQGVKFAVPTIQDNALGIYNEYQMPVRLIGVPENYDSINNIKDIIKSDGQYLLSDEFGDYALVSVGTAIQLQAHPGFYTDFQLYTPKRKGKINISNPAGSFRADTLFITGVFQVDQEEYDYNTVIVPLNVARHLFDYTNEASAIEILAENPKKINETIDRLSERLGKNYTVKDRLMQQEASFKMINLEKWITFLLLGFIMIIATFNVVSSVAVLIVEKKNDIATIRSLGAPRNFITAIFTSQTWLITLFGSVIGIVTGVILSLVQEYFGIIKLGGDTSVLIVNAYPVVVKFTDIIVVFLLTVAVSTLSSIATGAIMHTRLKE